MPSASGVGASTQTAPVVTSRGVLRATPVGPLVSVRLHALTTTEVASPAAVPALPAKVGVESPVVDPAAGVVSAGLGATVSTPKLRVGLVPVLPAASPCWTRTL